MIDSPDVIDVEREVAPAVQQEAADPLISVCIANYNGIGLVEACIDSVRNQSGAPPFEIIVHDDASTDGSVEWLCAQKEVRLIASEQNVGFCVSNNRMIHVARGEFILLLNNDASLLADALYTLVRRSEELKNLAILGMPQFDARNGNLIDRGCWLDLLMTPVARRDADARPPAMAIGACLWIPRFIWDAVGGFPEFFVTNAEDVYLCCAARELGFDVQVTMNSGFRHLMGSTQGGGKVDERGKLSFNPRRRFFSERNRLLNILVFTRWQILPMIVLLHWMQLILEGVLIAIAARRLSLLLYPYLQSQISALRCAGKVWRCRRRLRSAMTFSRERLESRFVLLPAKLLLLKKHGLPRA